MKGTTVLPAAGAAYLDRTDVRPGMIVKDDVVVKAFARRGFAWGGDYKTLKDYQHFEIPTSLTRGRRGSAPLRSARRGR